MRLDWETVVPEFRCHVCSWTWPCCRPPLHMAGHLPVDAVTSCVSLPIPVHRTSAGCLAQAQEQLQGVPWALSLCERRFWRLTKLLSPFCSPAETPAPPEGLRGPKRMPELLVQCEAWLHAYFHEPSAIPKLPVPALHHPVFQQGQ